jgi:uncharacterized repeat protein (TIGR02543 family)
MLSLGAEGTINSSVFIYDGSIAKIAYPGFLEMELSEGTVFLKLESRSEIAQIKVPYQKDGITEYATAKLTGGTMLLHLNKEIGEVQLWCLKDDCSLEFARESERTFAVERRSYFPATGTIEQPLEVMPAYYDELWAYNLKCNKCMDTNIVPDPTPTPTPTPTLVPPTATKEGDKPQPTTASTPTRVPTNPPKATATRNNPPVATSVPPTATTPPVATDVPPTATTLPPPPTATTPPTATFTPIIYSLEISCDPPQGGGYTLSRKPPFYSGDRVDITADPKPNWKFDGWGGACAGQGNPCTLIMDGNKSVVANFSNKPEE